MACWRSIVAALCLLAAAAAQTVPDIDRSQLVTLIPQQSCYLQSYNKRLTCNCNSTDTAAYLHLRLKYYVFNAGNEIRSVHLQHCRELLVTLDMQQVDATDFPIHFRAIRRLQIEKILFEPKFSDRQEMELSFDNVEQLLFRNIFVEDTLKLRATNVKEARFENSTFAHIPVKGFEVSKAKLLDIRDSTFLRVFPQSIVVEKTKEVVVLKNEMTVNALEAVYAHDGSHLMISCNRITGYPVSPECMRMTSTTSTTTTTTEATSPFPPEISSNQGRMGSGQGDSADSGSMELIVGVVSGFIIIAILVLVLILLILKKKRVRGADDEKGEPVPTHPPATEGQDLKEQPKPPPADPEPKESDALLATPAPEADLEDDDKPRFSTPIWLEEIQKNRIFNRQKSLLSQDGLKDVAEGTAAPLTQTSITEAEEDHPETHQLLSHPKRADPPHTHKKKHAPPVPMAHDATAAHTDEDPKESSRTESDEDYDRSHHEDGHRVPSAHDHPPLPEVAEPPPMDADDIMSSVCPPPPESSTSLDDEMQELLQRIKQQEQELMIK